MSPTSLSSSGPSHGSQRQRRDRTVATAALLTPAGDAVAPQVSVVVPTRNRARLLPRLLRCIADQKGVAEIELVVVDDSSEDETASVLDQMRGTGPLTVRTARTSRPSGAATARNIGWRLAEAPIVAFTDDDCRPRRDWLAELLAHFEVHDVVQGATVCEPDEAAGRGPFSQVVSVERWSGQFETSNVAYRRDVLELVGGFRETFEGDSFGEDVDLGWRAVEADARTTFAPTAIVVHDVKRGAPLDELRASLRHGWRWRHIGRVLRDHPAYRPYRLYHDPFLGPSHPPTVIALAGIVMLAAQPRSRAAWAAAAAGMSVWVRHRVIVEPRPGRRRNLPLVLPAAFLVDVVEVATVAGSGARYGTLVL